MTGGRIEENNLSCEIRNENNLETAVSAEKLIGRSRQSSHYNVNLYQSLFSQRLSKN